MMRSLPLQQKRSTGTIKSFKDVRKTSRASDIAIKNSSKVTAKKSSALHGKKIKRYTKQAVKTVLLSPTFHSAFKIMSVAVISVALLYASYFFIGKTFANEVVVSQSEIVARVSQLTELPKEAPYDVVRVQDGNALRTQNPFYKDIKEGDYILIYKDLAVIYDLRNNAIIGIKRTGGK